MNEPENPQVQPEEGSPPTEAGEMKLVAPPEGWPNVIGVLGLIFGILGALTSACGLGFILFADPVLSLFVNIGILTEEAKADALVQMQQSMVSLGGQIGVSVVEIVISIVLIVASTQLLKRKSTCVGYFKLFAVVDLMANTAAVAMGIMAARSTAANSPDPTVQQLSQGVVTGVAVVTSVLQWLVLAIWPVFLLIWFSRTKIKDSMSKW